ncbi:MFS transporter [Risungbinella massiliensis]|uniref:MFS transporter n=1 Tax=Risungbinella massiliensis TaxID=1329796 RepID=UPI0005CBBAA6|nr:MFS transporter [Risungbinella massiliensis]
MKWKWFRNVDRLDRQAWLLLVAGGLHTFSTSLSNTFVNVYLWKLKKDFVLIGWYNFAHFAASAITFILAGWLIKRVDRVISIRIGVILQALFFLTVLFLGDRSADYVILLGVFLGIGSGFYWLAYNVLYFEITERDNRDVFNGVNGLLSAGAGIIAPLLSGFIITRFRYLVGYRIVFALSLTVFVIAIVISFLLKARNAGGEYRLKEVLMSLRKKDDWYWVSWAVFGQGLREGVFIFLIGLLIYLSTKNELTLGTYYTVCSIISLFSYYIVGRYLRYQQRNNFLLFGAIMMFLIMLPYVLTLKSWAILFTGLGIFLFFPFYYNPLTSTVFDVIGRSQVTATLRVEYVVAREIAMNLGRMVSSFSFIMYASYTQRVEDLRWILLVFGSAQLLSWYFIRRVPLKRKTPTVLRS